MITKYIQHYIFVLHSMATQGSISRASVSSHPTIIIIHILLYFLLLSLQNFPSHDTILLSEATRVIVVSLNFEIEVWLGVYFSGRRGLTALPWQQLGLITGNCTCVKGEQLISTTFESSPIETSILTSLWQVIG